MGFGYGSHACPGRIFATNAVKLCLAEVLVRYDLALEKDQIRAAPQINRQLERVVDSQAKILLRRRQHVQEGSFG